MIATDEMHQVQARLLRRARHLGGYVYGVAIEGFGMKTLSCQLNVQLEPVEVLDIGAELRAAAIVA